MVSFQKHFDSTESYEEKPDKVSRPVLEVAELARPIRGYYIPVRQLSGQAASNALEQLQALMCDPKTGKIWINGEKGIGKTVSMKHLHNRVLEWVHRFDSVFWVTSPADFSIGEVQDAVAAAVKCDLSNITDLTVRSKKLCTVLAGLGRFVIFIDCVSKLFHFEEVGIPDPCEGNGCKVVLATSLDCVEEMVGCCRTVQLDRLPESEALELFMNEAGVAAISVSSIHGIAKLIVVGCCGLPSKIVEVANRLYGIRDIREWRNTLFELQSLGS